MWNQTLTSGLISAGLVLLGQPLVEHIRGRNARIIATRELRERRIGWWKDSIIRWQEDFMRYELDPKTFRSDPNYLMLKNLASQSVRERLNIVILPGEFGENATESEALEHQDEFLNLLEELMKLVVTKELEWVLN